ncbi:MAG: metallophosphoesterase [Bdellovibrionales bacterium]|nr:metallophosphoesterase [Bdellovibrionales bacterium]
MDSPKLHTIVLSDLHLADAELGQPGRSLWKRYKRPKYFIDSSFGRMLDYVQRETQGDLAELVLNGDIFDFDSVTRLPLHTRFHVSWLEKKRGLFPEEEKSRFKIETILHDHPVWVDSLRKFIQNGNRIVFIIGNHDIEMHWPVVQKEIVKALHLNEEEELRVRFCEWFYISNNDTAIEHGNQYDDYCVAANPIHPLIKKGKSVQVRLPFGNITSRYMINGMGLFNPHVEGSFLMALPDYFRFFYKYALKVQPWLPLSWLWSSTVSFWMTMTDAILPSMRDPLFIEQRVEEIARKANATPTMVRMMNELRTHPAIFNPIKVARELWLDRFLLLMLIVFVSFELYATINMIRPLSWIWFLLFFILSVPLLFFYSRNIKSEIIASTEEALKQAPLVIRITGTQRVIFGHTHREMHTYVDQTEVINTGTWSPAFKDPECRESYGSKCFAWIKPTESTREAKLLVWKDPGVEPIPVRK